MQILWCIYANATTSVSRMELCAHRARGYKVCVCLYKGASVVTRFHASIHRISTETLRASHKGAIYIYILYLRAQEFSLLDFCRKIIERLAKVILAYMTMLSRITCPKDPALAPSWVCVNIHPIKENKLLGVRKLIFSINVLWTILYFLYTLKISKLLIFFILFTDCSF